MRRGLKARPRLVQVLGALMAALSLGRTPLPQPDFHNVRHHDGAGEVCEHHDHLLRWHPQAGSATDVAVLHWHWFLLRTDGQGPAPESEGSALHAHLPDDPATVVDAVSRLAPDTSVRFDLKTAPSELAFASLLIQEVSGPASVPQDRALVGRHAPVARGATMTVALQRWIC